MTETRAKYKLPGKSEEEIQAEIVQFLTMEGWMVYEFAKPRSRPVCRHCGAIVGQLAGGLPPGWLDLLAIKGKQLLRSGHWEDPDYLHLEVKRPGIEITPDQAGMGKMLIDLGCRAFRVESVEDVARILRDVVGHALRTRI